MKARSPLLGYNHNVRYAGRLYHVQTEDSGLNNPHVFTHLFFGGTILASKRTDYKPEDPDNQVQKMMQAQHKGMLKELRAGKFDPKIEKHFGEPVVHDKKDGEGAEAPPAEAVATQPAGPPEVPPSEPAPVEAAPEPPSVEVAPPPPPAEVAPPQVHVTQRKTIETPLEPLTPPEPPPERPVRVTPAPARVEPPAERPMRVTPAPVPLDRPIRVEPPAERPMRVTPAPVPLDRPIRVEPPAERTKRVTPAPVPLDRPRQPQSPIIVGVPPEQIGAPMAARPPTSDLPGARRPPINPPPAMRNSDLRTGPPEPRRTGPIPPPPQRQPSRTVPDIRPPFAPPSHQAGQRPVPSPAPARRAPASPRPQPVSPYGNKPSAEGVVVARPAVIVSDVMAGRPSSRSSSPPPISPVPQHVSAAPREPTVENIFGEDLVSEKSLDEVILAYLAEDLPGK